MPEILDHAIASTADAVAAFIGDQLLPPTGACVHGREVNPESHGTHVAATAAGNHVTVTVDRNGATPQTITGVAPRARLAMYKVKNELLGQSTCCPSVLPWAGNAASPLTAASRVP